MDEPKPKSEPKISLPPARDEQPVVPATFSPTASRSSDRPTIKLPRVDGRSMLVAVVLALAAGLVGAYVYVHFLSGNLPPEKRQIVVQESSAVITVAKQVSPAVVSITTNTSQAAQSQSQQAAGTGMILTSNGLIMTNNHVISGATSVTVYTTDGKKYTGQVVAADSTNDYAFVQIKASGLPTVQLGDSSVVQVGSQVVAIGNALGQYQNTVTSGIISGEGRPVTASDETGGSSESLVDLFQTDAAINPGNSGGPLVNLDGQVIAMNTAVAGDAQNIGFAIPINEVKTAIASVESKGVIIRPYLGVYYVPITQDVAQANNLPVSAGAYVYANGGQSAVIAGSPAAAAGLQQGDIITKVDGVAIDAGNNSLTALINQYKVGNTVTLTVLRNGKTITLKAKLQAAPESQ